MRTPAACVVAVVAVPLALVGCGKPNGPAIELRKQIQTLESQVAGLRSQVSARDAQVAALQKEDGPPLPALPPERLGRLFTVTKINVKRLTGGEDLDPQRPGDEGFKVSFEPVDQYDDPIKLAGSIKVELFDLSAGTGEVRLGTWTVDAAEAHKLWISSPVFDGYVFARPWQTPPTNGTLLAKVTFTDELTGRVLTAQRELTVTPPATTATATTRPSQG